jgi:WD40 repeat protein/class 3 adenylate cyclase
MTQLLRERYEVLATLGAGGEGRVVKALDHQHDRLVALKIFSVRSTSNREALLAEARILLGLAPHPALPLVREDFFDGDEYVIAMDWVDGTDLARLLRTGGRPGLAPSSVLAYLADAADALTYLHTQDEPVIHGDVKPANLILTRGGRVKLVDFGVSSMPNLRRQRAGTPGFRAPELGAGGVPSRASDVYSLAATAFALLTGTAPSGVLPTWDGTDPDQAARLEDVIRLGLATDPARRPDTPGEFVERLRAGWGASLPTGVITFCLSDIVGSPALWEQHPDAMASALVRHDDLVAEAVEARGGRFLRSMGDSTFSVFDSATHALEAAIAATEALAGEEWPGELHLDVRFALHTGEGERRGIDYFGPAVNLAARLRGQADGGQILVSAVTAELVSACLPEGYRLVDLGSYRLRGVRAPEAVFALAGPNVAAPLPANECPYRGLEAFEAADRRFFFGREEVVAELTTRLAPRSLLALVGASGSGKSSVLHAGLVGVAQERLIAGVTSVELCTPGPGTHVDVMGQPGGLVVVDQFEELFTLNSKAEREAFIDALLAHPGPVVIGIRADFYGRLSSHSALARAVASNQILLGPMNTGELRRAITEPARAAGLRLEAGLVEVIVRDVAGEPGALPLLSHALRATWERRDGRTLTVEGYRETGGVSSAIARTADRIVQTTPEELHPLLRSVFLRLSEIGDGVEDTRRRVDIDELVPQGASAAAVDAMLGQLADARLVTLRESTAEVAHEALIREWPALRAWLEEDREGLRLHRRLGDAARLWAAGGHDPSDLYRGTRLEAAREWSQTEPEALNENERAFLDVSLELADRERAHQAHQIKTQARTNRRLRRLLAGVALALVIALVAGTFALVQRNRADDATRRATVGRLVAESGALRDTDPSQSALLAVAANRLDDNPATRGALQRELIAEPRLRGTLIGRRPYGPVAYTPDGTQLIARGDLSDDTVDVFDARHGRLSGPPVRLPAPAKNGYGLAISPDGKQFATGGGDHQVHIFDIRSRREVGPPMPAAAPVTGVAFSPDGSTLATGSAAPGFPDHTPVPTDQTVQLWDVATHRRLPVSLGGHTEPVPGAAFSPDGRLLATAGNDHLVVLHDPTTGATIGAPLSIDSEPSSAAFSPDSRRLAVGTFGQNTLVFDVHTGLQVASLDAVSAGVTFSPDGARLVTSSTSRGKTIVWDAATFTPVGPPIAAGGLGVAFRPDGHELAIAQGSGNVSLWDPDGKPLFTHPIPGASRYSGRYSPDGRILAVPDTNSLTLYDARTLQPLGPPLPDPGPPPIQGIGPTPTAFAFSPDGTRLAIARATVEFYDVASQRRVGPSVPLETTAALSLGFSPDGKTLAVGGGKGDLYLVDPPSGRRRGPLPLSHSKDGFINEAFSPDGRRLVATTTGPDAVVYDHLRRAEPRATRLPDKPKNVSAARFSPDGSLLATGNSDGSLQLRDGHTLRPLGPSIPTNQGFVIRIGFTRDGRLLAVSDSESAVRLVDVATRQPIGDAFVGASFGGGNFRPDGRVLALSGPSGAALVTLDSAEWRADVCRLAGRNLTPAESREHLGTDGPRVDACPGYPHPH